jgi:CDP-paratose 2-epimerase
MFGLRAVINRCSVVSGPWQMGYAEQGIFSHWMLAHVFKRPLAYLGYGGRGLQVRDVLHVTDLADLIHRQLADRDMLKADVYNVGGGLESSASLAEFTEICAALTGVHLKVDARPETRPGDVPIYVTDNTKVTKRFGWAPKQSARSVASDLFRWIDSHADALRSAVM